MESLFGMSLGVLAKTVTFCIAAFAIYRIGMFYDRKNRIAWKKVYDAMEAHPQSMAIYFGLRILAFAVLAGYIFG